MTERMRPLRIDGRRVHQVALPWHWGYARRRTRATRANDLAALSGDPNVVDPGVEGVHLRRARGAPRRGRRRARLRRRRRAAPAGRARRGRPDGRGPAADRVTRRAPTRARRAPARARSGWASSPTRRSASAARRARSPASSGTTCPPTAPTFAQGRLLRPHRRAVGGDLAPRALRRAARAVGRRRAEAAEALAGERRRCPTCRRRRSTSRGGRRHGALDLHVRRLQALHERRLHGRVPDRRADPHRVRDRGRPARRLQRLRLLHPGVPVRRHRPRPRRRPRRQVHALLRPPAGRPGAGVREGVPDRLDPVRALRRARRGRRAARGDAARPRPGGRLPLRRGRRARRGARRRARRVLPADRAARALRAARAGRLADPGERRPARRVARRCAAPALLRRRGRRRGARSRRAPDGRGGERRRATSTGRGAWRARARDDAGLVRGGPARWRARRARASRCTAGFGGRALVVPLRARHALRGAEPADRARSRAANRAVRGGELPADCRGRA